MFSLPLYIFLFLYFGLLIMIGTFFLVNILHLTRTGTFTFASFAVTIIVLSLTLATLLATSFALQDTDWQQNITFFNDTAGSIFTTDSY